MRSQYIEDMAVIAETQAYKMSIKNHKDLSRQKSMRSEAVNPWLCVSCLIAIRDFNYLVIRIEETKRHVLSVAAQLFIPKEKFMLCRI